MLKKVLAAACALAVLSGTATALPRGAFDLGATVGTEALSYGDFEYTVLDDGTAEIAGYTGTEKKSRIPSEIGGKTVTSIAAGAFAENVPFDKSVISDSARSISDYAYGLWKVAEAEIIPTVSASVLEYAASLISDIASVNLATLGTTVGKYAAEQWAAAESQKLPEVIGKIGNYAASLWNGVEGVDLSAAVESIALCAQAKWAEASENLIMEVIEGLKGYMLSSWMSLFFMDRADAVAAVSAYTAELWDTAAKAVVPKTVSDITDFALSFMLAHERVIVPNSVTSIGENAFGVVRPSFRIVCFPKSAAHNYALDNGIGYVLFGDVTGDNSINMLDLTSLQRHINGWDVDCDEDAIDVDNNRSVDMNDLTTLQRRINGWDV